MGRVSIPFREDLYSDVLLIDWYQSAGILGFHPFQGRPLFGHIKELEYVILRTEQFPSLSGKTSIRTSLSARMVGFTLPSVSIPFREDLYSD